MFQYFYYVAAVLYYNNINSDDLHETNLFKVVICEKPKTTSLVEKILA